MSRQVTQEISTKTHKGKGEEVKFTVQYTLPTTHEEVISELRGEENLVKFVAAVLGQKKEGAAKSRVYNYSLTGDEDTPSAREKCIAEAITACDEYAWSERGVGAKTQLDNARAIAANPNASLEDIRKALGL